MTSIRIFSNFHKKGNNKSVLGFRNKNINILQMYLTGKEKKELLPIFPNQFPLT